MKNLHLEHPEDLLFDGSTNLYRSTPFHCFHNLFQHVCGASNAWVSIKWDGAPAIVFGIHPISKMFFIGTKSVFSGKIAFSENQIPLLTESPQLREKLTAIFELRDYLTSGVYQADVLWWNRNYKKEGYFFTFQPNTLKYLVEQDTNFGYRVGSSANGIVVHTEYTGGPNLTDMDASFKTFGLLSSEDTYILNNPKLVCHTGTITSYEVDNFQAALDQLSEYQGYYPILYQLSKGRLNTLVRQFINYCFRKQKMLTDTEFCNFIRRDYEKEAARLKTDKGKRRKLDEAFDLIQSLDRQQLSVVFTYIGKLLTIKAYLVQKLDKIAEQQLSVKVQTPGHGYTGHEGYVVNIEGSTLPPFKMVNRHIFSVANMNFEKDWIGK